MAEIACINCGKQIVRKAPSQKYCPPCSQLADLARKKLWGANNPQKVNKTARTIKKRYRTNSKEYGKTINSQILHGNITWSTQEQFQPSLDIGMKFCVPFDFNYSKNALWRTNGKGHVYIREEANQLKRDIAETIKLHKVAWKVNKVYIDLLVQKPNLTGDPINVIDTIADAIKNGIGLDDNWFCIKRLDWEIVKERPQIWIGIYQENENKYPCCYCGVFKTFDNYRKGNTQWGIGRECRDCLKVRR